jgi:hypothetical protein
MARVAAVAGDLMLAVVSMLVVRCAVEVFGMANVPCRVHVLGVDSVSAVSVVVAHGAPLRSLLATLYP